MNKTEFSKGLKVFLSVFLLMILQTTANGLIKINNVIPDLLFAFAVSFACTQKNFKTVIVTAFILGVLSDFVCHSSFSGYTAIYTYSAALGYFFKNLFIKPNIIFLSVIALILFIAGKTVLYPVFCSSGDVGFSAYFVNDVIPASFYNVICFFIMTAVMKIAAKKGGREDASGI